ncbi:MAG: helix-turn-helix transcriptional regulator [Coriobacteriales bacterium]|jgi:DNA-binding CsgD family transcriptional regulator|nr:helix-turn-helix transcriptional regulator [Coriobacteriales bacterium]
MNIPQSLRSLFVGIGEHREALGFSCFLAWVVCIFYTNVVEGFLPLVLLRDEISVANGFWLRLFLIGLPVFCSVLALSAAVAFSARLANIISKKSVIWAAAILTTLSTLLLFAPSLSVSFSFSCFVLGSLLTGAGSGLLWVIWGAYYTRLPQEQVEQIAPVCVAISAIVPLLMTEMHSWLAITFVAALPLVSLVLLNLKDNRSSEIRSPKEDFPELARMGFGIFVACLFVSLATSLGGELPNVLESKGDFVPTIVFCIAFLLVISLFSTIGPRRISISSLYRWMCPALVIAFAALVAFDPDTAVRIRTALSLGVRLCFILITVMYFSSQAKQNSNPIVIFAFGWICVHLGDFFGVLIWLLSEVGIEAGYLSVPIVAVLSICILVVVTMFVLNEPPQKTIPLDATADADNIRVLEIAEKYNLTKREIEVLELLAKGRSIPYIRDALFISKETAATHARHIYHKLGVHNKQELLDLF